jgi:hypothetical protein
MGSLYVKPLTRGQLFDEFQDKMYMIKLYYALLFILLAPSSYADDKGIRLFTSDEWMGTLEWRISTNLAERLPSWSPDKKSPPCSLERAIQTARAWVVSLGEDENPIVNTIYILPITPNQDTRYLDKYYYRIRLRAGPAFNYTTCIVLMDGSVLEPVRKSEFFHAPTNTRKAKIPNQP